ncbi:hypothetical protein ACWIGW_45430 [Nocardia brasiliensis]
MRAESSCGVRVFQLHRDLDGTVSMRWRGPIRTTVEAACLDDIRTVHGHDGATRIVLSADSTEGTA